MTLQLNVFGGLSLTRNAQSADGGTPHRRALALLAILSTHAPRAVSREKLAALLWPESGNDEARNSLKQVVYRLRRDFGAEIVIGATDLRLGTEVLRCDRVEFERLLAEGAQAEAVALYAGPFLDGFHIGGDAEEFERWADGERAQLERRHAEALVTLARAAGARGDATEAVRWWRRLVECDPLNGGHASGLIQAYVDAGDRTGALRHADAFQTRMHDELGLTPDASFRELVASVRASVARPALVVPAMEPAVGHDARIGSSSPEVSVPSVPPSAPAVTVPEVPRRSWRNTGPLLAGAVVVALAMLGAAPRFLKGGNPPPSLPRVALVERHGARAEPTERIIASVAGRLSATTVALPVVVQVAPGGDARAAARGIGAALELVVADAGSDFDVQLNDANSGQLLWGARMARPTGAAAEATMSDEIAAAIASRSDARMRRWIGAASAPRTLAGYDAFMRAMVLYRDWQPADALPLFHAAAADSGFVLAGIMEAWALYAAGQAVRAESLARAVRPRAVRPLDEALAVHQAAVFAGDLGAAYRATDAIAAAAPRSEWTMLRAQNAMELGRVREAVRLLEAMASDTTWLVNTFPYWMFMSRSLHHAGAYERELAALDDAVGRFPTNRIIMQRRLAALAALGRIAEVNAVVDQALTLRPKGNWGDGQPLDQTLWELMAHGHRDAAARLAQRGLEWLAAQPVELQRTLVPSLAKWRWAAGDTVGARRAAEVVLTQADREPGDYTFLAMIAMAQGDTATTRRMDAELTRISDPRLAVDVMVERAGVASIRGDRDGAVRWLRDALRAGYAWRSTLHVFPEYARVRGYPPFEALIAPVD